MASYVQDEEFAEFISPFLKSTAKEEETILVTPKEPSRTRKVYVVKKEAGLTGRNYMQCSSCGKSSFKFYRSATRASVPGHLKYLGTSDSDQLRFCRSCWYGDPSYELSHESMSCLKRPRASSYEVSKPNFERCPLGVTDQRACFSWHFIQRDFVRRKVNNADKNVGQNGVVLPLVSVVGQDGSEFVHKDYNANYFNVNGKEVARHVESGYSSKGNTYGNCDEIDNVSSILLNIQRDHDYAPVMQREIEITTSARSPIKNAYKNSGRDASKILVKGKDMDYTQNQSKRPVHQVARKLIKKSSSLKGHQQISKNFLTLNLPVSKVEEQLRTKRERGEDPDPSHLMGLKATAENGQTMPGLICPLCGIYTVKSYSVWKKETAPAKIKHLFKNGVTVIRACRKCVPYPLHREKKREDRNNKSDNLSAKSLSKTIKSHVRPNGKRLAMNGCLVSDKDNGKISDLATTNKGQVSKIEIKASKVKRSDHVVVNVGVRVARVNLNSIVKAENLETINDRKKLRNSDESDSDRIKKCAKLEEKKRKMELENGGELTGLECFESLQPEFISGHNKDRLSGKGTDENRLFIKKHDSNEIIVEKTTINTRGHLRDKAVICDRCNKPLGKVFRTIKQSKCPKKFSHVFMQNKARKSIKICRRCTQK